MLGVKVKMGNSLLRWVKSWIRLFDGKMELEEIWHTGEVSNGEERSRRTLESFSNYVYILISNIYKGYLFEEVGDTNFWGHIYPDGWLP